MNSEAFSPPATEVSQMTHAMPKKPAPVPAYVHLTVEEVAHFLHVSPGVIYELVGEGDLPALHVGRLIRTPRQAFLDWLAAQGVEERHAEE